MWFISALHCCSTACPQTPPQLGREVAIPVHLQDGEEFTTPIRRLIQYGEKLFNAKFTVQEGAGPGAAHLGVRPCLAGRMFRIGRTH